MNFRLSVLLAGLTLLVPAWIGLFAGVQTLYAAIPVQTLYAPLPALTIIPAFALGNWNLGWLAILIPSILFFLWNPGLFLNQRPNLPKRTLVLLGLLTVLTILDWPFEWPYGIRYLGMRHTVLLCILDGASLGVVWAIVLYCQKRPSLKAKLLAHWALFAWLAWYAFPWFGELP